MQITFPGGTRVDALCKGHVVRTDQPEKAGGGDSAPAPFDLFLASIGTCAGYYVLQFCQKRGLDSSQLGLTLEPIRDEESRRIGRIRIEVQLPAGFPEKYHAAILRAVDQCAVKRHILEAPEFEVRIDHR